jgi:hypothetical protein
MTETVDITVDEVTGQVLEDVRHTVRVDTTALLTALRAVLPHVGPEDSDVLHRVRVRVDDQGGDMDVLAVNGYSLVVARVAGPDATTGRDGIVDNRGPGFTVDLNPGDVANLIRLFKPGRDELPVMRLDVHSDGRVTCTDVSGLFDGRALTVPSVGTPERFPDVYRVLANAMTAERGVVGLASYTGRLLAAWARTAAVYDDGLILEPTAPNKPFVVTVGAQCVGALMPRRHDDDPEHAQNVAGRGHWLGRCRTVVGE